MILDDIKNKLKEVDENVFYGAVNRSIREMVWDYIVFERKNIDIKAEKTGRSYYFTVHIVREEFIPEGIELDVIDKMLEIPGMKLAGETPTFDYIVKPNTDIVVEMLSISFVRPVKGWNRGAV